MHLAKRKKICKWLLIFITAILTVSCQADIGKQNPYVPSNIKEFVESVNQLQVGSVKTAYIEWNSSPWAGLPPENNNEWLPIRMDWEEPTGVEFEVRDALAKFPFQKIKANTPKTYLTVRFFEKSSKEILRISFVGFKGAILINGEAYKPTPELVKSLRYFMPYVAYEQIRKSSEYGEYFVNQNSKDSDINEKEKIQSEQLSYDQAVELAKQYLRKVGYYKDDETVFTYDPKCSFWNLRYAGSPELLQKTHDEFGIKNNNYFAIAFQGEHAYLRDGGATAFVDKEEKKVIGVLYDNGHFVENSSK